MTPSHIAAIEIVLSVLTDHHLPFQILLGCNKNPENWSSRLNLSSIILVEKLL
jgi:hypothetical protein